jgi:hypothetical protein
MCAGPGDVPDVQQVEAAVGEDDLLAPGAPSGYPVQEFFESANLLVLSGERVGLEFRTSSNSR